MPATSHPRREKEPHVGIFWLLHGKPVIDGTPLSEAEPYGDHLTHPRGHAAGWSKFQHNGIVPVDIEYDEPPRGRVIYNTKARRFTLLADKCILRDKGVVRKVMSEMNLPIKNPTGERTVTIAASSVCVVLLMKGLRTGRSYCKRAVKRDNAEEQQIRRSKKSAGTIRQVLL